MQNEVLDLARKRLCPNCKTHGLLPGPKGGASQNFYCLRCQEGWNLLGIDHGVFGVDPLGLVDPGVLAMYAQKAKE